MKTLSPALQTLLATREFWRADLYVLTLVGGAVLRYAAADCDVKDTAGNRYSCGGFIGPYWDRDGSSGTKATAHQKLGTDVDQLTIDMIPGSSTLLGLSWQQAARQGVLRDATFQRLSAYAPAPPSVASWPVAVTGTVIRFTGIVGEIDGGDSALTFTINSALARLQRNWPRNLYSPACVNIVGDYACGATPASQQGTGAAVAGSTSAVIQTNLAQADGTFDLGVVAFTSGVLAGSSRSVRRHASAALVLMTPFPAAPAVGDTFTVIPGCDGSMDGEGCPKFNNLARFRGFPFIPVPATAGV